MLLSMTGFGVAQRESTELQCAVEVRSVNNRYLKIATRLPDSHSALEREVEKTVRDKLRRGTVSLNIRTVRHAPLACYRINQTVALAYLDQLRALVGDGSAVANDPGLLGHVLELPGVVEEPVEAADVGADWPLIRECVVAALDDMERMRRDEGAAMQRELLSGCRRMDELLARVDGLASGVVARYHDRLLERIASLLDERGVVIRADDLVREVAIFAERADVAEEVTRLKSHVVQFQETMEEPVSQGRKLDFLSQEMYRESNTLGSKASDVEVARIAVDLKTQVERIREIIQNVE